MWARTPFYAAGMSLGITHAFLFPHPNGAFDMRYVVKVGDHQTDPAKLIVTLSSDPTQPQVVNRAAFESAYAAALAAMVAGGGGGGGGSAVVDDIVSSGSVAVGAIGTSVLVASRGGVGLVLSGTWTGSVVLEASINGTRWDPVTLIPTTGGDQTTILTTNGAWEGIAAGTKQLRVNGTGVATGSVSYYLLLTDDPQVIRVWADQGVEIAADSTGVYWPAPAGANFPSAANGSRGNLLRDVAGNLMTRGAVTTDETGVRDDFSGSTFGVTLAGTVTLANGGTTIVGAGTSFLSQLRHYDYVRLSADAESAWAQIQSVSSDTSATLVAPYTGAGGSGAAVTAIHASSTGAGGSQSVSSSLLQLASGTTSGSNTLIYRSVDFGPLAVAFGNVVVSQRVANQDFVLGFQSSPAYAPSQFARFRFTGTNAYQMICEAGYVKSGTPTAADIEAYTINFPGSPSVIGSMGQHRYRIETLPNRVRFYIDDVLVATCSTHMPDNYDVLQVVAGVYNTGVPATNGTLTIDSVGIANFDRLVVGSESQGDMPTACTTVPGDTDPALPVRQTPADLFRCSFAQVGSGLQSAEFTTIQVDSAGSVNQSAGNLVLLESTTANAETLIRSNRTFRGAFAMRYQLLASQRIANTTCVIELADLVGSNLALTINSATSITVTIPNNPFTVANVGQSVNVGAVQNVAAGAIPGRYAIASVSGNTITLTVAGWPASGSGTCTLYGWNYYRANYNGATATNVGFDTQRCGWNSGDSTLPINTTASPGHIGHIQTDSTYAVMADALAASAANPVFTPRGSRLVNIPDDNVALYLFIRTLSGSTAPASATTWTVGFVSVETFGNNKLWIAGGTYNGVGLQTLTKLTDGTTQVGVIATTTALKMDLSSIAGTATVTAGVAGTLAVGGNVTPGTAATLSPLPTGAVDDSNLTRRLLTNARGTLETLGSGEIVAPFSVGTGAAAVTDGTNGKTFFLAPREHDLFLSITAISTGPTMQVEGSHDGVLWSILPFSRVENTAASQQNSAQAAFTPAVAQLYRGRSYGFPMIRVHLTAGTTSTTVGTLRAVPVEFTQGTTVSYFGLNAANTTESVGVANGQVPAGGVRTMRVPSIGACKAVLEIDYGVGAATTTLVMEGSTDGTNFNAVALSLQPVAGGPAVTSFNITGTTALPQHFLYETDVSNFKAVRVRATAAATAVVLGSLRLVPIPAQQGVQDSQKPTYAVGVAGAAPTASTNLIVVESAAAKQTVIKRLWITPGTATAAGTATLTLVRNTVAASAAGTAVAPAARDSADPAFAGLVRTGAFTLTGVTQTTTQDVWTIPTPISTATNPAAPIEIDLTNRGTMKGIVLPVGVTNGAMFVHSGLAGAAGFGLKLELSEL